MNSRDRASRHRGCSLARTGDRALLAIAAVACASGAAVAAPRILVSGYDSDDATIFGHPGGAFLGKLGAGGSLNGVQAIRVGPEGLLYVANEEGDDVVRYDRTTGAFVDVFVQPGAGGLDGTTGLTWGPDGDLYVPSFNTDSILHFDGTTGAPVGTFVAAGSGGLDGPDAGTIFGPGGDLYVPSYWNGRVLRYDGATGAALGVFITGIARPRDLEFRPGGLLYVSSDTGSRVNEYDAATGAFLRAFVAPGSGGLSGAYSIEFDDAGSLYVVSLRTNQVLQYRDTDGSFIGVFADGAASGIVSPVYATLLREDSYVAGMGAGPANENRVRIHDHTGSLGPDFLAYAAGAWGVNVAGGNVSGTPAGQVLTAPGPGIVFGPQVRGFLADGTGMGKINYYAYGTLKYGANVTAANLDADRYDEIVTGPGPGSVFGPHVRGWSFDGNAIASMAKVSYYAYQTLRYGVIVAGGDVDADLFAEILTGPGPGQVFGPQVRGWNVDGAAVTGIAKINFNAFATTSYGVNVASAGVDRDAYDEIACAPGPGTGAGFAARFLAFDFDGAAVIASPGFDVTLPGNAQYGGRVALGDVDGDRIADLVAGGGPDPAAGSTIRSFSYWKQSMTPLLAFDPFASSVYGVNVGTSALGQ
ncbi:MAG: hypothetical protein U0166_21660 [Acidobacteriota bacterium]